jgi:hypothetical protein
MYNESVATSTTIYMVVSASQSASEAASPSASPSLSEAASPVHTLGPTPRSILKSILELK